MKSKKYIYLLIISFMISAGGFVSNAQQLAEKKKQEHQAVIDLLQNYISSHPRKSDPSYNRTDAIGKYNDPLSVQLRKSAAFNDRKSFLMNGNKIKVGLTNYGGIGMGYGGIRTVTELLWHGSPYIFQFTPLVGASVPDAANPSKRLHIISDGLNDYPQYNLPM